MLFGNLPKLSVDFPFLPATPSVIFGCTFQNSTLIPWNWVGWWEVSFTQVLGIFQWTEQHPCIQQHHCPRGMQGCCS